MPGRLDLDVAPCEATCVINWTLFGIHPHSDLLAGTADLQRSCFCICVVRVSLCNSLVNQILQFFFFAPGSFHRCVFHKIARISVP